MIIVRVKFAPVALEPPFLLVDDSSDDVLLIRRAFIKARLTNPLHAVSNGSEAIAYLNGDGNFANRNEFPLPELVLLDINMPGLSGFDVLRWIRLQPQFKNLRVVMLTSSDVMRDVTRAYELGANSFLIKPLEFERFAEFSQALAGFWRWTPKPSDTKAQEGEHGGLLTPCFRSPSRTRP